eukprot:TRINITY_DN8355_c0_g1_i1.p1 TRINITY_DN8355_c0_g1~~TRINITY_DN8355_c0_g1_i1.p1  ORF type:complete len:410 (-),score=93.01 TRINITY_DN8355_c0_g1_i1:69-1298(-)
MMQRGALKPWERNKVTDTITTTNMSTMIPNNSSLVPAINNNLAASRSSVPMQNTINNSNWYNKTIQNNGVNSLGPNFNNTMITNSSYQNLTQMNNMDENSEILTEESRTMTIEEQQNLQEPQEHAVVRFGRFVDKFSTFSSVIGSSCDSVYNSIDSFYQLTFLLRNLRQEIVFIAETFTVFKIIQTLIKKYLFNPASDTFSDVLSDFSHYSQTSQTSSTSSTSKAFEKRRRLRKLLFWSLLFFGAIATFVVLKKIKNKISQQLQEEKKQEMEWNAKYTRLAVATYDYEALTQKEVSMKKGDKIKILNMDQSGWWEACNEATGAVGFIPFNYVQIVDVNHDNVITNNVKKSMETVDPRSGNNIIGKRVEREVVAKPASRERPASVTRGGSIASSPSEVGGTRQRRWGVTN